MRTCSAGAALILFSFLSGCADPAKRDRPVPDDFPNVLNLRGAPDSARDLTAYAFSDLGSWAMYGLPDRGSPDGAGGFPGPLLLSDGGLWLSPSLVRLEPWVDGLPVSLSWAPEGGATPGVLPGLLRQDLEGGPLGVRLELVFASDRVALVTAVVRNMAEAPLALSAHWVGGPFFLETEARWTDRGVALMVEPAGTEVLLEPLGTEGRRSVGTVRSSGVGGSSSYRISVEPMTLDPGRELRLFLQISVFDAAGGRGGLGGGGRSTLQGPDRNPDSGAFPSPATIQNPEGVRAEARDRWSRYLETGLAADGRWPDDMPSPSQRIAVKAMETLLSNWRRPRGGLGHDGLFPSYAYRGFHGFWSWDSWKHARALALFAPELAREQVRAMLDHQAADGMVPDVVYVDSREDNWRDTKPPLAAWAVHGILGYTADTSFVAEVLPALIRYHRWWYLERDHDGNGLCEYGSTDGTRIAAAWESGMDNAVRFDRATMVRNGPEAWSLSQESVDLNAYLFAEKGYLADLYQALGRDAEAKVLRDEARELGDLIRDTFFDGETGYFYDVELASKDHIRVRGPEGWIPLWAGVASREQAEAVARVMLDPGIFAAPVPLPTLAMDHPSFDPSDGYWRGPVWLDQAYFGIHGLARYGMTEEARSLARRILENAEGLAGDGPIFENYHPVTGAGLNAPHFSWSAAHLLMLYREGLLGGSPADPVP